MQTHANVRHAPELVADHFAIVEVDAMSSKDLFGFMPFAGNQDAVSRFGLSEGPLNRPLAVDFGVGPSRSCRITGKNVLHDLFWIFGPRVVAREDGDVGARSRGSQQRSFCPVPIPS